MIEILRKDGFILNPSDKTVNALLKMIERNEGRCPCSGNTSEDLHCPCSGYTKDNICICGLYKTREIWKPIRGFEEEYEISNYGRVHSLKSNKILKQFEYRGGYLEVHLRKPGTKVHKKIHRLVAEHFIPNPENLPEVNHKDEDRQNNNFTNLEWCSHTYNNTYNGKHLRVGAKNHRPINQYDLEGNFIKTFPSQTEAAKGLGINQGGIADCARGHIKTYAGYIWRK